MGSPAIFTGRRTKLLTADGILTSKNAIIDNDGVKNYIANGHAEINTTGWATYADAAGTSPVDGTGGTPTVTWTRTTTLPLSGQGAFLFTKDAVNRQGEGVSYNFSIDLKDRAKVLQINVPYIVTSGTFVAGSGPSSPSDLTVWIYDVTNAVLIQPSSISFLSNSTSLADNFSATFQTSSNSSSYRLIFHVGSTSASAYTIMFDNISVSPQTYVYGTPVTDWQSYTPTLTSSGGGSITLNATAKTDINGRWRRVGDCIELQYSFQNGSGGAASGSAGTVQVSYPTFITPDTTKLSSAAGFGQKLGSAVFYNVTLGGVENAASYNSSSITFAKEASGSNIQVSDLTASASLAGSALIPVSGWSSSVQTSDQTDTRIVDFISYKSSNEAVTASSTQISYTAIKDSHGAWNGNQYIVQVAGDYTVTVNGSASGSGDIIVYVNAVARRNIYTITAAANTSGTAIIPNLNIGDVLTIRCGASITINGAAANTTHAGLYIRRESGPSAIAASELVVCRYTNSAGTSIGTTATLIPFANKTFDSHGAWNTSTSTFTAPITGKYLVRAKWAPGAVTNNNGYTFIYKNGSQYSVSYINGASNSNSSIECVDIVDLIAGDTVQIYGQYATAVSMNSSAVYNTLSIARLGN